MSRSLKVAWGTLGVSFVALATKASACWVTRSVALCSDALETIISVVSAVGALAALWIAEQPAHGSDLCGPAEAECLAVVVEDVLVLAIGLVVGHQAWLGWQHVHMPNRPLLGLALNGAANVASLVWALALVRCGRAWRSPTLVAIGKYAMIDVFTSGVVLAGFALMVMTGCPWVDPAVATLVAVSILWTGCRMLKQAVECPR